jgi:hypothetical protein
MKPEKDRRPETQKVGRKNTPDDLGVWRQHRIELSSDSLPTDAPVQTNSRLTDSEKVELLRAKLQLDGSGDAAEHQHHQGLTQQIHREDPQAGYDQPRTDHELNGIVPPNPKDARNEEA